MKVAVTGASGLIGRALVDALRSDGHEVLKLVRRTPRTADEHRWDPKHRRIDPTLLADVDAVVNLAGEPIRPRPWTRAYKERLLTSRLDATLTVSEAFAVAAASDPHPAAGAPVGLRHRLLRGHRRPSDRREHATRQRLPGRALRPLGGRHRAGRGRRGAGRAAADRPGDRPRRDAHAGARPGLQGGTGRAARLGRQYWPWISLRDEVDAIRFLLTADVSRPGEPDRPDAGDQRGVHPRARRGGAPSDGARGTRVRDLGGAG